MPNLYLHDRSGHLHLMTQTQYDVSGDFIIYYLIRRKSFNFEDFFQKYFLIVLFDL